MAKGVEYPEDLKAWAMAKLLTGSGPAEVKRGVLEEFDVDVPIDSIKNWGKKLRKTGGIMSEAVNQVNPEKAHDLSVLILGNLAQNIETQTAILKHATDPKWLNKQDAASLGTFMGISADKAIKTLEAIERANQMAGGDGESS